MKSRFYLIGMLLIICGLKVSSQERPKLNPDGSQGEEYFNVPSRPATRPGPTGSSNTSYRTMEDVRAASAAAYAQSERQIEVADRNISDINSKYRGNGRNTFSGFGRMTSEQQRAFDYFARLEREMGSNISVTGTNALTRTRDASTRGAATSNPTRAFANLRAAVEEMPGTVLGIERNGSNNREAQLESTIRRFNQLSPTEKQKEYNNTYSELVYRENEIKNIEKSMEELHNNYNVVMNTFNSKGSLISSQDKRDKDKDQQLFNWKSRELNAEMSEKKSIREDLEARIAAMKEFCPQCGMPD